MINQLIEKINVQSSPSNLQIDKKKQTIALVLPVGLLVTLLLFSSPIFAQTSVLASGTWFKIGVTKSGIYELDKSTLELWGINTSQIDARTFKIFGNGVNGALPQENHEDRPFDLLENAIYGIGTEDGMINDNDRFLFYANGPNMIDFDGDSLLYSPNIYTDTAYYFFTFDGESGKRVQTVPSNSAAQQITNTIWQPIINEDENTNLISSGRSWVGPRLSNASGLSISFDHQVPGFTGNVKISLRLAAQTEGEASFDFSINNSFTKNLEVSASNADNYVLATANAGYYEISIPSASTLSVNIEFNRNSTALTSIGYLDYYHLAVERSIILEENQLIFWNHQKVKSTFEIPSAVTQCWDISTPYNAKRTLISNRLITTSGHKLIAFDETEKFDTPTFFGQVKNQNIKSLTSIDGLIVTPPLFKSYAQNLADFHATESGLNIAVVTTRQIYNEFSSGGQDLSAIRDYVKYLYETGGEKLKYILLYGDGSFDYKNRTTNNSNFVPIYESRESLHGIYSYSSDDYIAFLEDDEGLWREARSGDHTMEVGVGRLPIKTLEEAQVVNEKIIRYATSKRAFGDWRNKFIYIADDGDNGKHMSQAEQFNAIIKTSSPEVNVRKLYLDAFEQVLDEQERQKSPEMQRVLLEKIREGALIVDYMGHGNETGLMQEAVITTTFINQLDNRHKLPLFVTATCDFGKYDNPNLISGAERLLLSKKGGAIALLTTTRPVFAQTNEPVNEEFHRSTFGLIDGQRPRLGDIVKQTKNKSLEGPINRNFALLGDPFLTLNYADYNIEFNDFSTTKDTLKALEEVTISGKVTLQGQIQETFEGNGTLTLWDIPQSKVTKGSIQNNPFTYSEQTNALFRGEVIVKNGQFSTTLIIPKNTSYKFEEGKINAYFFDEKSITDASGGTGNIFLGGSNNNAPIDIAPPNISLYINENAYKAGMTINQNNLFVIKLSDESGINISQNGFNQDLTMLLNDSVEIVLNEYYQASPGSFQQGAITFPMENLNAGDYRGQIKVWDTHNNSSEMSVDFKVSDQPILNITNVSLYPNPIRPLDYLNIQFSHDREGDELMLDIGIYDLMGNIIIRETISYDDSPGLIENLSWLPSTSLDEGIYFMRIKLRSNQDGASNNFVRRLVIIN